MTVADIHPDPSSADAAYRLVRETTAGLLAGRPTDAAAPVTHCPGWTVRDLVAHLVEICGRVHARVTGVEPGPAPSGDVPELLAQWERLSPPVERFLAGPDSMERSILVMDAFTHELDLRQALGAPPPVDHPALPLAVGVLVRGLSAALGDHGLPALAVRTEHGRLVAGTGEPAATVSGPWHEVYLALAGRRSAARIRSLDWSADPGRWLPAFTWGPFRVPESSGSDARR